MRPSTIPYPLAFVDLITVQTDSQNARGSITNQTRYAAFDPRRRAGPPLMPTGAPSARQQAAPRIRPSSLSNITPFMPPATLATTSTSTRFGSIGGAGQGQVFRPFSAWSPSARHRFYAHPRGVNESDTFFPKVT